jgi:hypothetical protein
MEPSKIAARPGKGDRLLRRGKGRYSLVKQFTHNKWMIQAQSTALIVEVVNRSGRPSADILVTEDPRDKVFEDDSLRVFVYADIPGKSWKQKWAHLLEVLMKGVEQPVEASATAAATPVLVAASTTTASHPPPYVHVHGRRGHGEGRGMYFAH